MNEAN